MKNENNKNALQCINGMHYTSKHCTTLDLGTSCDAWQNAHAMMKEDGKNVKHVKGLDWHHTLLHTIHCNSMKDKHIS
jgi:hypothetical protein